MYELIILSLLMRAPRHGYRLAKIINDKIGPWARLSNGTLYPMLARLERDGYITVWIEDEESEAPSVATAARRSGSEQLEDQRDQRDQRDRHGDRSCRTFAITPKGQRHFHTLMLDTTSNQGDYQRLFRYKVSSLPLLSAVDREHLLDHYRSYCERTILFLEQERRDLERRLTLEGTGAEGHGEHRGEHRDNHDHHDMSIHPSALDGALEVIERQLEEWRAELAWALHLRDRSWPVADLPPLAGVPNHEAPPPSSGSQAASSRRVRGTSTGTSTGRSASGGVGAGGGTASERANSHEQCFTTLEGAVAKDQGGTEHAHE